jgi:hypothetical protein
VLKRSLLFYCLFNSGFAIAAPAANEDLQLSGRALANYQVCTQMAEDMGDNVMHSYYAEMFADGSAELNGYSPKQQQIAINEFNRSVQKLGKINKQAMGQLCLSRFDTLSRKMQEKKLSAQ